MIDKREILDRAAATGLNPHVVEKDYVLGWLLWGVANHEAIADNWIFKGGTCLRLLHQDALPTLSSQPRDPESSDSGRQRLGSRLLVAGEELGRARGCHGAHLTTYSFQAPGFYERHGYERFGELRDYPGDQSMVFLRKPL